MTTRRNFIRFAAATSVAAGVGVPAIISAKNVEILKPKKPRPVAPIDTVRIATIGMGIIGFEDTSTALATPGVELVAVADLYDGRLKRAKEVYGNQVATTRDYREVLARPDVDAVLVCTPDHWHTQIAVDAMAAGKAVYCEKPMVQKVEEGHRIIEAQKRTGQVLQVGSQFASDLVYHKAKELYASGAIGALNLVEATYNRNSSIGAWQYSIPPDASPETIDWDRFIGSAPKRPFDPIRFFRWRNYQDYGTAVAGDLFVHLLTGIHLVTNSLGPTRVVGMGGLRYWKDGRDVPDVILGLFDYPENDRHPGFNLALQCNFKDGGGGDQMFRFIGSEGVITVKGNGLTLTRTPTQGPSENEVVRGYNSVRTFSEEQQEAFTKQYRMEHSEPEPASLAETRSFETTRGYDARYDHFVNFFTSMREGKPVLEDPTFGFRAAAPALMVNMSYYDKKVYNWDPVAMRIPT